MKRHIFKLTLFLLAGAIINVAVAWTVLAYAHRFVPGALGEVELLPNRDYSKRLSWHKQLPSPEGGEYGVIPYHRFGWRLMHVYVNDKNGYTAGQSWIEYVGWPSLAFHRFLPDQDASLRFDFLQAIGRWPTRSDLVAHDIIWPGFAINTIFYAAIVWMLFAIGGVPGAVRRKLRHKRGQCASCGYSLRDISSDKCPECGATA